MCSGGGGGCGTHTEVGARVGALDDGVLAGVVQHRALGQRDVRRHPGDGDPEREEEETTENQALWSIMTWWQEGLQLGCSTPNWKVLGSIPNVLGLSVGILEHDPLPAPS